MLTTVYIEDFGNFIIDKFDFMLYNGLNMKKEELQEYFKKKYPHTSSFTSGLILFFVDILVLMLSIGIGFFIVNLISIDNINFKSFINYSIYIPVILIIFACEGLYPGIMIPHTEEVKKFCGATFFSFVAICLTIFIPKNVEIFETYIIKGSNDFAICFAFMIAFIFATFLLPSFREFIKRCICNKTWWGVPAVIYCTDNSASFIVDRLLKNPYLGYKPAIIIDSSLPVNKELSTDTFYKDIPVFPESELILREIRKYNIKTAIMSDFKGDFSSVMSSYRYTITVSKRQNSFTSDQRIKDIAGIIGFSSTHNLTFKSNLIIKRLIDILIILMFSPLLIPVFILLMFLTKITSKGPIFYGHRRVGKNGKEFKCWKFRSMCIDADKKLAEILENNPDMREEWEKERKFTNDPRVTKFGKFLRKTSLDELPQLINILIGQMSFVGPRPVTEPELEKYGPYKDYVLSVTPGLSGMWQTSGRSDTEYEERIALDTSYIQNWSIWLDIWILIKTVYVVLKGRGAY